MVSTSDIEPKGGGVQASVEVETYDIERLRKGDELRIELLKLEEGKGGNYVIPGKQNYFFQ